MKSLVKYSLVGLLALRCVSSAQAATVLTDPSQTWGGYMNVFSLPADGGGYLWGSAWGAADLRATFSGDALTLRPCTNVSNPTDAYWVKPDGTGNKQMEASYYVDTASLLGSEVSFSGNVVDYTLSSNYTCNAFIKVLNDNYSTVLQQVQAPLTNGNSFFTLSLTADAAGAAHVQYGFAMVGPNASITNSADSDGFITIRTNALRPKNALVNPGFEQGLTGWTPRGNGGNIETTGNLYYNGGVQAGASNVLVFEGLQVQKVFPTFTGGANYSGVFQEIPTGPGSTWAATARSLTHQQDLIGVWEGTGTNQYWIEVTFRDSLDLVIGEPFLSRIIDNASPVNTWLDMQVTNHIEGGFTFTAPAGTAKVRFEQVYHQPTGYAGGSVYADQMVLENLTASDPNITSLPANQTKLVGETATFTVVATGSSPLTFQWKTNGVDLVNGGNISGATSSTLTIANVQKSQAGLYTVDVTSPGGTLSASATLTVKTAAEAANKLENPSFESGAFSPWSTFNGGAIRASGDIWGGIFISSQDGNYSSSVDNGGEWNGAYQDVPAAPGQIFTADGWFFLSSFAPLTEGNEAWLEVQFRNGSTPLALYKSVVLGTNNPALPLDTWFNLQATNGFAGDLTTPIPNATYLVAPPSTTTVRYQVTFHVVGGSGGVLYDNMRLMQKIPVTLTPGRSANNISFSWPTQGATDYQVMVKDNVTDAWAPLGSVIAGDGTTKSASFPLTGSARFYSVVTK